MNRYIKLLILALILVIGAVPLYAQDDAMEDRSATWENLYPEGVDYDAETDRMFFSSLYYGGIFVQDESGEVTPFVGDDNLISSVGILVDSDRNRLLVANADPGVGAATSPETVGATAGLGIYNLETGDLETYVDLGVLLPDSPHFANDLAVDDDGNAYITDSFSPVIYKVSVDGEAEVLLMDDTFSGEGFVLNGIVYHPDGYLITVKGNEGTLFKIPLDDPTAFIAVASEEVYLGADGLEWDAQNRLVVITNFLGGAGENSVNILESSDEWETATLVSSTTVDVPITTGVVIEDMFYAIAGNLNNLFNPEFDGVDEVFNFVSVSLES